MGFNADRLERALDDALYMTFPASDPIAVSMRGADAMLYADERLVLRASPLTCGAPNLLNDEPPPGRKGRLSRGTCAVSSMETP